MVRSRGRVDIQIPVGVLLPLHDTHAFQGNHCREKVMNVLKMLNLYRRGGALDITAEYADTSLLLPEMAKELGTFEIKLPPQAEPKKVKVRPKLTMHGTCMMEGAQFVEEEECEEVLASWESVESARQLWLQSPYYSRGGGYR